MKSVVCFLHRPERDQERFIYISSPDRAPAWSKKGQNLTAPVQESEDDLLDALIAENKVSANLVKKC